MASGHKDADPALSALNQLLVILLREEEWRVDVVGADAEGGLLVGTYD